METNLTIQGNRLNIITKKVTSWAAIIAVPTAVTGFYGQNLPYPGSSDTSGFITSTVLIVVLSSALYITFRKERLALRPWAPTNPLFFNADCASPKPWDIARSQSEESRIARPNSTGVRPLWRSVKMLATRMEAAGEIVDAADRRDAVAEARDSGADIRERQIDRAEFIAKGDQYGDQDGEHFPQRRAAALDREHAKGDRTASQDDRLALTEDTEKPGPVCSSEGHSLPCPRSPGYWFTSRKCTPPSLGCCSASPSPSSAPRPPAALRPAPDWLDTSSTASDPSPRASPCRYCVLRCRRRDRCLDGLTASLSDPIALGIIAGRSASRSASSAPPGSQCHSLHANLDDELTWL